MSAPETVRLKRKRQDDPLDALVLTRSATGDESATAETPQKRIRYRLVTNQATKANSSGKPTRSSSPVKQAVKRLFHLKRSRKAVQPAGATPGHQSTSVPVFEERHDVSNGSARHGHEQSSKIDTVRQANGSDLKRPGKSSSLGRQDAMQDVAARRAHSSAEHRQNMQALADMLHEATLEELAQIPKPSRQAKPRMSSQHARVRHERNVSSRESTPLEDTDMVDADFVYDTYTLMPMDETEDGWMANVGYLVIDKDDEEYWESFMDDLDGTTEEENDEDDENAEDYYTADYPEDEDGTDDEQEHHVADASRHAQEDEWDLRDDTADDHESDLSDRYGRGGRVVRKWEKILHGTSGTDA